MNVYAGRPHMDAGRWRAGLVLGLLVAVAATGCISGDDTRPTTLIATVENSGEDSISTTLTITGPEGNTLLSESFRSGPGETTFDVPMEETGTYELATEYQGSSNTDAGTQRVSSTHRHTITTDDCTTPVVEITFLITYTSSDDKNQWRNQGSQGTCLEDLG